MSNLSPSHASFGRNLIPNLESHIKVKSKSELSEMEFECNSRPITESKCSMLNATPRHASFGRI